MLTLFLPVRIFFAGGTWTFPFFVPHYMPATSPHALTTRRARTRTVPLPAHSGNRRRYFHAHFFLPGSSTHCTHLFAPSFYSFIVLRLPLSAHAVYLSFVRVLFHIIFAFYQPYLLGLPHTRCRYSSLSGVAGMAGTLHTHCLHALPLFAHFAFERGWNSCARLRLRGSIATPPRA